MTSAIKGSPSPEKGKASAGGGATNEGPSIKREESDSMNRLKRVESRSGSEGRGGIRAIEKDRNQRKLEIERSKKPLLTKMQE